MKLYILLGIIFLIFVFIKSFSENFQISREAITSECFNEEDPVTLERFDEMSDAELQQVVKVPFGNKNHCFKLSTIKEQIQNRYYFNVINRAPLPTELIDRFTTREAVNINTVSRLLEDGQFQTVLDGLRNNSLQPSSRAFVKAAEEFMNTSDEEDQTILLAIMNEIRNRVEMTREMHDILVAFDEPELQLPDSESTLIAMLSYGSDGLYNQMQRVYQKLNLIRPGIDLLHFAITNTRDPDMSESVSLFPDTPANRMLFVQLISHLLQMNIFPDEYSFQLIEDAEEEEAQQVRKLLLYFQLRNRLITHVNIQDRRLKSQATQRLVKMLQTLKNMILKHNLYPESPERVLQAVRTALDMGVETDDRVMPIINSLVRINREFIPLRREIENRIVGGFLV